jgi:hypothetical protein
MNLHNQKKTLESAPVGQENAAKWTEDIKKAID